MIAPKHPQISIQRQCELIHLPRSSYYNQTNGVEETKENLLFMELIDKEYTRYPFLGSRKMRNYLRRQGHKINRKRVQRLMQKMGIMSVSPKPNTSLRNKAHTIYPYLLRHLTIDRANQAWCTDITYIKLQGGFVYLVAIMDWYSRKVLSWELSNTMESDFCISALQRAIRRYGSPEIFNTDQGSQFTSRAFTDVLKQHEIKISMDGKGRWMDNIFIERLWRSVKYEDIYIKEYKSVEELRLGLGQYFQYYNYERTHQSHGSSTPTEIYNASQPLLETAA